MTIVIGKRSVSPPTRTSEPSFSTTVLIPATSEVPVEVLQARAENPQTVSITSADDQLLYCCEGEGQLEIGDVQQEFRLGEIVSIAGDVVCNMSTESAIRWIAICSVIADEDDSQVFPMVHTSRDLAEPISAPARANTLQLLKPDTHSSAQEVHLLQAQRDYSHVDQGSEYHEVGIVTQGDFAGMGFDGNCFTLQVGDMFVRPAGDSIDLRCVNDGAEMLRIFTKAA